jgi:hypothetical protein
MRSVAKAAAAVAAATTLAVPTSADATAVCVENNQLTFSPPLTTANRAGTVRIDYQAVCPDLPGLTPRNYASSITVPYFGSCLVAFIAEGGQSVVVGGTVYAFYRGSDAKAVLLQPDRPCDTTTAHGTGVRVIP